MEDDTAWSEEKRFCLIDAYRVRENLWNPQNENYFKKNLKQDAWSKIAILMSMTVEKCNSKIMAARGSYEDQQKRLQDLFDAVSTPESSEDPFADDGEYGNDQDYEPSGNESISSDDAISISATRRIGQRSAALSSGESSSSSSSDSDADRTVCSANSKTHREDIETSLVQAPVSLSIDTSTNVPSSDEQPQNMPILTDGQSTSINDEARESDIPVTEESWSTTVTDIPDFNFDNSATGITVNIDDMEHVIDFFHLMFPQNYVQYLVDCTNAYGMSISVSTVSLQQ
ncbi:unnamed protein product [Pieris brassicae]|uniref:MADF domain-containing protein n=1 Tax=Pieris brassicae TaxID=7116 RepID=A0A9P0TQX8_PIEBR|nr:unnamed protein product [Pieris brassicae]